MSVSNHDLCELDHAHLWHPFTQQRDWTQEPPLIIERGEGSYLFDSLGNRYIDGVSSLWTNVHGHRHPRLDQAIREQLDRIAHSTMLGLSHPTAILLAKRLIDAAPGELNRVFYSDNGSTATEVAIKMAFQYHRHVGNPERTLFATLTDAYHGDTVGSVSIGAISIFHEIFRPLLFRSVALPAPVEPGGHEERDCLERGLALLDAHGRELAALVVEPLVQGAAGMKMHSVNYLRPLIERARSLGILVIADEVAVGFGRTGTMFAMEQVGLGPDLLCLAKGLAAGYLPLAATLTTERIYEAFLAAPEESRQFFHGHTFTGNPLACAAALASLDLFEETHLLEAVNARARELTELLTSTRALHGVQSIRQRGLMVGIDLVSSDEEPRRLGHEVAMACRPRGAIVRPLGNTVVINPPLSIQHTELADLVRIVNEAVEEVLAA